MLPITVDTANDSPKVIVPHHYLVKLGAFDIRKQHPTTQPRPISTESNLTVSISTDTTSAKVMLRGMSAHKSTIEVINCFSGARSSWRAFTILPLLTEKVLLNVRFHKNRPMRSLHCKFMIHGRDLNSITKSPPPCFPCNLVLHLVSLSFLGSRARVAPRHRSV